MPLSIRKEKIEKCRKKSKGFEQQHDPSIVQSSLHYWWCGWNLEKLLYKLLSCSSMKQAQFEPTNVKFGYVYYQIRFVQLWNWFTWNLILSTSNGWQKKRVAQPPIAPAEAWIVTEFLSNFFSLIISLRTLPLTSRFSITILLAFFSKGEWSY